LFGWRSRYWTFLLKLDPNRPSTKIQSQPGPYIGPFHWESRRLRLLETKRLMTFPDDIWLSREAVVLGSTSLAMLSRPT
jgi:DNA (cytosine-5)-methyltransferase 1